MPRPFWRRLLAPRFSLQTLMLVVTLVGIGLWWRQRAVYFWQMAERHRREANIYLALQEAHPSMSDKCTSIVKYFVMDVGHKTKAQMRVGVIKDQAVFLAFC